MNKRQKKKLETKLIKAIIELNNDIAEDFHELQPCTERDAWEVYQENIKGKPAAIQRTLRDYRKFILKK